MDSVNCTREQIGDVEICHISGKLDVNTISEVEKNLQYAINSGNKKLVIDLHGLEYLSSAGIKLFLQVNKKMESCEGMMIMTSLNKTILEIITISGLNHFFYIAASVDEAIKEINKKFTG